MITTMRNGDDILTEPQEIANHVVSYFQNIFCTSPFLQDQLLAAEFIPNLIGENINDMLTILPSHEEIKQEVFSLNKDGAPGPNGFEEFFLSNILGKYS